MLLPTPPETPDRGGVPLAVWAAQLDNTVTDAPTHCWLGRLVAEYTPASGRALLVVLDTVHPEPQRQLSAHGLKAEVRVYTFGTIRIPEAADLVVLLAHDRHPAADELSRAIGWAHNALRPAGLLAVVTQSRPQPPQPHDDLVARSVVSASAAGFGYLQHLIIADLTETESTSGWAAENVVPQVHRTAHLDVTIFRQTPFAAAHPATEGHPQ